MPAESQVQEGKQAILDVAALCFMEQGYHATSIDDVARRLRATKGRVYILVRMCGSFPAWDTWIE